MNKPALDVLDIKERRLTDARVRGAIAMSNLTICLIADNSVLQAQAAAKTAATIVPTVAATTFITAISSVEK